MLTVTERLRQFAEEIRRGLTDLISTHSQLYRSNEPGSGVFNFSGNHHWRPLSVDGRRIQAQVLEEYRRFSAILRVLFKEQPGDTQRVLTEAERGIMAVIQQDGALWAARREDALAEALVALDAQVGLLDRLYGADGSPALVPDTNALLHNPALEGWQFDDVEAFTLVLAPAVVSELDRLKVEHRNESVRGKAEQLIRRLKEYRRRGGLTQGVPLVTGRSRLLALAVEPRMEDALPWLDASNADDRIVASVLEVMRRFPRSPVALVTRDLNLQNKAEFARIPYLEPPEPGGAIT